MCLIIDEKQCPNGYKIAKKNIPCYKVLIRMHSGSFKTPCRKLDVDIKTGIEADNFQTKPSHRERIDYGVHSYTNLESAHIAQKSWSRIINPSIHAEVRILKGYIPKGAKYWIGILGELCSERIIFA